jgi:hypothetical protein
MVSRGISFGETGPIWLNTPAWNGGYVIGIDEICLMSWAMQPILEHCFLGLLSQSDL